MTARRATLGVALFFSGLVALLLLVPFPASGGNWTHPALVQELENLAHPVAFGLLAWLWLRRYWGGDRPDTGRALVVVGSLAALGGFVELLQIPFGRDPSWRDAASNTAGAVIGACWIAKRRQSRLVHAAVAALCLLLISPLAWTVCAYVHRHYAMPVIWNADHRLFARFSHFTSAGNYPGLSITEPYRNWRGFAALRVSVKNDNSIPVHLMISVQDGRHRHHRDDRYDEEFVLPASSESDLEIPLDRIEEAPINRILDLTDVRTVLIFQRAELGEPGVQVQQVRLSR
jgi:VanZ family protein